MRRLLGRPLLIAPRRGRGRRSARRLRGRFLLQCHFSLRILFTAGPRISRSQLIVTRRIIRLHLHIVFQRRDRIRKRPVSVHRDPQRKVGLHKPFIQFCGSPKVADGLLPLPGLSRYFAQQKLRCGAVGINLQLLFEFLLCILGIRRSLRQKQSSKPVMNPMPLRILLSISSAVPSGPPGSSGEDRREGPALWSSQVGDRDI